MRSFSCCARIVAKSTAGTCNKSDAPFAMAEISLPLSSPLPWSCPDLYLRPVETVGGPHTSCPVQPGHPPRSLCTRQRSTSQPKLNARSARPIVFFLIPTTSPVSSSASPNERSFVFLQEISGARLSTGSPSLLVLLPPLKPLELLLGFKPSCELRFSLGSGDARYDIWKGVLNDPDTVNLWWAARLSVLKLRGNIARTHTNGRSSLSRSMCPILSTSTFFVSVVWYVWCEKLD